MSATKPKYVIAINGSPRKDWNTGTLLQRALEGAASVGAKTELINLRELKFRGCCSCFGCKLKNGPSYGQCAMKDDLADVLHKIDEADVLFIGSPIYWGDITADTRAFLERMCFRHIVYDSTATSLVPGGKGKKKIGMFYTMNVNQELSNKMGYHDTFNLNVERPLKLLFGDNALETYWCYDTYQFHDYSKYVATRFDEAAKAKNKEEQFPVDCKAAFDMGARFSS